MGCAGDYPWPCRGARANFVTVDYGDIAPAHRRLAKDAFCDDALHRRKRILTLKTCGRLHNGRTGLGGHGAATRSKPDDPCMYGSRKARARRFPQRRRCRRRKRRRKKRFGGHGDGWLISVAALCAERYGWALAEIKEGCSLSILLMLLRQPGPDRATGTGITCADMDLFDWMDANGKKPGDDLSEYYEQN